MVKTEQESIALIIGKRVLDHQERHRKYVSAHSNEWKELGAKYRKARDSLKISRRQMRILIGISEATIARFERGCYVKARKIIEAAYRTALRLVQFQCQQTLTTI